MRSIRALGLTVTMVLAACAAADGAGPDRGSDAGAGRDAGRDPGRDTGGGRDPVDGGSDPTDDADAGSGADATPADDASDADSASPDDANADTAEETGAPDAGSEDVVEVPDVDPDAVVDGGGFWDPEGTRPVDPEICPDSAIVPALCIAPVAESDADLCDTFDNDCDGEIDEGCTCKLGEVQPCFAGPPGRVNTGACTPGTQRCVTDPSGEFVWGDCEGGISPRLEVCDELDNDCNGCVDELGFCAPGLSCPAPGDPRTPDGVPFEPYPLIGRDFYSGEASAWSWTIVGGPCDDIVPGRRSFELTGANSETATFTPLLSGSYTVTLRVTTPDGIVECTWIIHIVGPGVRIEMCYPESMTQDDDLFLMRTSTSGPWFPTTDVFSPNPDACSWNNCEASIRGSGPRANWGYANTDIANCSGGPQGSQWRSLGYCANPRLDIDNNLSEGTGLPENINIDNPRSGDSYRIMVHNFSGTVSRPIVNVYCGGRLKATFGASPDFVTGFAGARASVGAMWRVADVLAIVLPDGTTDCEVVPLHPPGADVGYDVTVNDRRY